MLNQGKKFAVVSLGCKVNRAEVDSFSAKLISEGWALTEPEAADLVIINTCTVTSLADKKTRQTVRKVCKESAADKIIVTGCASAIEPDIYKEMDSRIEIVTKRDMQNASAKDMSILAGGDFRTRAALKIQDGCNNACTYCIVHTARGSAWSMPHEQVEESVSSMLDAGIKEIVLSGVDIGAYDDAGFGLVDLCKSLLKIIGERDARIRISSIEPNNVSSELIELLANAEGKVCRHLHMPLQSGSSKVLAEMDRHYSANEYLDIVEKLKAKVPSIALSTDIIVGFPGESDEDFKASADLAHKCGFMKIHVFPYSKRSGTPAAERADQVADEIKAARAAELRKLSDELAKADLDKRHGTDEFVLVENELARTESYHLIDAPKGAKPGDLIKTEL